MEASVKHNIGKMILTTKPSEFSRPGYAACVYYDPEPINYDFSEWEDDLSTGWFNFMEVEIGSALKEYSSLTWEPYDAGAIFCGDLETCQKVYELIRTVEVEHPYFDLYLEIADFKCQFKTSECISQEQVPVEWISTHSTEESTVFVERDENFGNIIWVTNSPWMDTDNAFLICDRLSQEFEGFYFVPCHCLSWIHGDDGCTGIQFTVSKEPADRTLAAKIAKEVATR